VHIYFIENVEVVGDILLLKIRLFRLFVREVGENSCKGDQITLKGRRLIHHYIGVTGSLNIATLFVYEHERAIISIYGSRILELRSTSENTLLN